MFDTAVDVVQFLQTKQTDSESHEVGRLITLERHTSCGLKSQCQEFFAVLDFFKFFMHIFFRRNDVFENFKKIVPDNVDTHKLHLSQANTRARLRMTTLYYFAGIYELLVAGTGNKVEDFGVGFYTKYGDGGVDLSPIADLLKSEVYSLGAYLKVPDSILKASPSDGLFGDERTDEDQLGASYDELE